MLPAPQRLPPPLPLGRRLCLARAPCPRPGVRLASPTTHPRHLRQVGKYQEQPQLLDPLLEGLVAPLTALLRAAADQPAAADLRCVRGVSRLLWQLSVVRRAHGG